MFNTIEVMQLKPNFEWFSPIPKKQVLALQTWEAFNKAA